jgi:hypothetical protein
VTHEERYRDCVIETWPCGCRRLYTRTIVGDSIEQADLIGSEACRRLNSLLEREMEAEGRMIFAYTEHGEHSLEYQRSASVYAEVHTKIEEHCDNSMPTIDVLGAEPFHEGT